MFLEKKAAVFSLCFLGLLCSCSGKKNGGVAVNQNAAITVAAKGGSTAKNTVVSETVRTDPRHDDLKSVLSKMSARFKGEVSIPAGKYDAFLSELEQVLLDEKNNSGDDISLYYLIDKKHYAGKNNGKDYVPADLVALSTCKAYAVNKDGLSLRREAYDALTVMGNAARADGVQLTISSTYRSYKYQENLFQHWVDVDGLEEAERESARAGTSQHQLGVAVDFGSVTNDFAYTKQGKWMYSNAAKYGWSLSFPQDHEDVTGFKWESWHFRYIGAKACALQKNWFYDIQQYMLEFIDEWKKTGSYKTFTEKNGI